MNTITEMKEKGGVFTCATDGKSGVIIYLGLDADNVNSVIPWRHIGRAATYEYRHEYKKLIERAMAKLSFVPDGRCKIGFRKVAAQ